MKQNNFTYPQSKPQMYRVLRTQLMGLIDGIPHLVANLANASALLNQALTDINWVGFYLLENDTLVLGPFQGKPACIEIKVGKGVCGTAVSTDSVMLIENVHRFPGHIACDSASNSEIVIPLHDAEGKVVGVLDIDSPTLSRFGEEDKKGLLAYAKVLEQIF